MGQEVERLHKVLGVLTLLVVLAAYVVGGLPWYHPPRELTIGLLLTFLVLVGFGGIIETLLENR